MAPPSVVRVCRAGNTLHCQVEGWGTMAHSLALRRFAEQSLESGADAMDVDLRRCQYLDSTFLGTLLALGRSYGCRQPHGFALLAPAPECLELLHKMKLDLLLPIHAEAEATCDHWHELPSTEPDIALQRCVLQAHQELANAPCPGKRTFANIAEALSKELDGSQST